MRSRTTNNNPWAIVVVPAEGDPGGLLAVRKLSIPAQGGLAPIVAGTRGARPPEVLGWAPSDLMWPSGLVLWWDGALVPEGWDRLLRCIDTDDSDHAPRHPPVGEVVDMANYALRYKVNLASRVVLLDLVDGRLVEREPSGPEPQQR